MATSEIYQRDILPSNVFNMLEEEYLFAKTGSGPIETFTIHVVAWAILCSYLNIW